MNRRVHSRSFVIVLFVYCCAVALFADGANITDLFPSTTTVHFDEVFAQSQSPAVAGLQDYHHRQDRHNSFMTHGVSPARFVMLDQDSPSEPAGTATGDESIGALTITNEFRYCEIFSHENLYLNYCTLLL
jgi:hypothetical protein